MQDAPRFTALIVAEGDGYLARCPELDVVSQGPTPELAHSNLAAAVRLLLEAANPAELAARRRALVVGPLEPGGG